MAVLGVWCEVRPGQPRPDAVLVTTPVRAIGSGVSKIVTAALVIALALSSLNAIIGCARSST